MLICELRTRMLTKCHFIIALVQHIISLANSYIRQNILYFDIIHGSIIVFLSHNPLEPNKDTSTKYDTVIYNTTIYFRQFIQKYVQFVHKCSDVELCRNM